MAKRMTNKQKWVVRSRRLRELTDRCVVCFGRSEVVHHLGYRPGGRGSDMELPEDMVVLCAGCHNDLHRLRLNGRRGFLEFRDRQRAGLAGVIDVVPEWVFD